MPSPLKLTQFTSVVGSNAHPFPRCSLPTDIFQMPTLQTSLPLEFAHCRPPKSSSQTLGPSGGMLGLAPSSHLSQIKSPNFLQQLLDKNIIQRPIYSIMLINGQEGVLSIGGTTAKAVEMVVQRTKAELDSLAAPIPEPIEEGRTLTKRGSHKVNPSTADVQIPEPDWQQHWRWSKVQGAEGWWQILMQGVWIDGSKVLKNQPVVIDVSQLSLRQSILHTNQILPPDQYTLYPSATSRRQSLLRFGLRLPPTASTLPELLRFPLPQPTYPPLRI